MLEKKLSERKSFTVDTGNLAQYTELMMKRHVNSSAELTAAFAKFAKEGPGKLNLDSEPISLSACDLDDVDKADIKTTLKVFLPTFSPKLTPEAVELSLRELKLGSISQVILQFPKQQEDMEDEKWLEAVLRVWCPLEKMAENGKIHVLGVSDTDVERLRLLCENAEKDPPKIDHYSIDGCCAVPSELVEFAKLHDIQLLTHNDARTFDLCPNFKEESVKLFGESIRDFTVTWAARYTIWLRSRSVMAAKGYLVHFEKEIQ
ncbi:unnamed protein product, partial [Mesorhabditis belari]|uniref:GCS light chain n=1 Tax=Mesorhabditis belari TaxID=2138241 RepID=A0AAF3EBV8_9BILA